MDDSGDVGKEREPHLYTMGEGLVYAIESNGHCLNGAKRWGSWFHQGCGGCLHRKLAQTKSCGKHSSNEHEWGLECQFPS